MRTIILMSAFIVCITTVSFKEKGVAGDWEPATKQETLSNFERSFDWFRKTNNYQVSIKYASYTNYNSVTAYEKSEGYYKRDKKCFQNMMLGIRTIQNEALRLTVDTLNKMMILNNTLEINVPIDTKSISELMDKVKAIKKQKTDNGTVKYRLEFNPNELYTAYEFEINEKGLLSRINYFYTKEIEQDTDAEHPVKGKPRVEISFSNYQTGVNFIYEKEFSEKAFIKEKGKKYVQEEKFKNYELKDYRFSEKK